MGAPFKPFVIERQEAAMLALVSRPGGAIYHEIATALGITTGGAQYRVTKKEKDGLWFTCSESRTVRRRVFSSRDAMLEFQRTQPSTYAQVVHDLMLHKQPLIAADLAKAVKITVQSASGYFKPMARRGEVFGVFVGHTWWWYKTEQDAKQGRNMAESKMAEEMARRTAKAVIGRNRSMRPGIDAPVSIRSRAAHFAAANPDFSRAKTTVSLGPAFDIRYQVDPSERIIGGFASAGIGRYL